jgi:CHAT domain-containing protein/Tfp pilus assembly protein PilF
MTLRNFRLHSFVPFFFMFILATPLTWAQNPSDAPKRPNRPTLLEQSAAATQRGDDTAALQLAERALARARVQKDRAGEMEALVTLGMLHRQAGNTGKALEYWQRALPLMRELDEIEGQAMLYNLIGNIQRELGEATDALASYGSGWPLARKVGNHNLEALNWLGIGQIQIHQGKPKEALDAYRQALPAARAAKQAELEADILNRTGVALSHLEEPVQALQSYQQALVIHRRLNDKRGEGITLNNIGEAYRETGDMNRALEFYNRSLAVKRANKDVGGEVPTLNGIAKVQAATGQMQAAITTYEQALRLVRETGNQLDESILLNDIGVAWDAVGQPDKALASYLASLEKGEANTDLILEANTLTNIGAIHFQRGEASKAMAFYNQALQIAREAGDRRLQAATLHNIGVLYGKIGQQEKALPLLQQALALEQAISDKPGEAGTLNNLGTMYYELGQRDEALKAFQQAMPLLRQVQDKSGEATLTQNIAFLLNEMNEPQEALQQYRKAIHLLHETGDRRNEAIALTEMGRVQFETGEVQAALQSYEQARKLAIASEDRYGEAVALLNTAHAQENGGQNEAAIRSYEAGLALLETLREALGGVSGAKSTFLSSRLLPYHGYINLLLRQKRESDAFAWSEKTKARSLLDLLSAGQADLSRSLTPSEREKEHTLRRRADELGRQLLAEAAQTNPDEVRLKALRIQLQNSENELERFTDELYTKHPNLAAKRAARTATLQDIAAIVPSDTVLLSYTSLSSSNVDHTVVFCVTQADGKAELQTFTIATKADDLSQRIQNFRAACADPQREYSAEAKSLYKLLIAPAEGQLKGKKRLLLSPDASLWGVPFQALQNADGRFLAQDFDLVYAYSATSAQASVNRTTPGQTEERINDLLIMANPKFDSNVDGPDVNGPNGPNADRALIATSRALIATSRALIATSRETYTGGKVALPPLPGTQIEADALRGTLPATVFTGEAAQEATAKEQAGRFRYLHFATHGLFNPDAPLLSSIALAAPPVSSGEDGFLSAREIFDLDLRADMVVLSACETARGKVISGEGMVGLTWALFVAGSPTQVVSQWKVDDASTAILMREFYTRLKAGQNKDVALRMASLQLQSDREYAHPFYWAPFILMGDWR